MAVLDLFSKRQRRSRGEVPDVYQYESLPPQFRAQVVHILTDLFGDSETFQREAENYFKLLHNALCREYGRFRLSARYGDEGAWRAAVFDFLMSAPTAEVLDMIELAFRAGRGVLEHAYFRGLARPAISAADAIAELNTRFRERGIGFQFESGDIIRVDSQVLHTEVVKPALSLLAAPEFSGANAEFLKAHEHHRHGRQQECINECLKALESTLKIICKKRRWTHRDTDTANTLIDVVFKHGLVPDWMQSEFSAIRSTLEGGVPTGRNKSSAHGQGAVPRDVPPHLASYLLHLTASVIVFLVESDRARA